MEKKIWVKFKEQGAPFGFAYCAGNVVELNEKDVKSLYAKSVCIPADEEEIAVAKAALAFEYEIALSAKDEMESIMEENAALRAQLVQMQKEIEAKKGSETKK